jgi:hypothetical protein
MFWRSLVTLITVFWMVMTTLLVRVTYFPEGFQFAQLPPGAILKLFLDRGASGKQLHLYHGDKKIGHVTLDLQRIPAAKEPKDYMLLLSGMVEAGVLQHLPGSLNWRMSINLRDGRRWAGANGRVWRPELGEVLNFNWPEGRPSPEFTLHRRGELKVDDKLLQPLLGQFAASPTPPSGVAQDDFLKVSSREGAIKIAGQNRRGYVIGFSVMDRYRATAFFTEEGDLALIDLPDGYRALEPNIHGLVPDEPDEPEGGG